jgi:hypothetical protein
MTWQPDEDDAPWSPERDEEERRAERFEAFKESLTPEQLARIDDVVARFRGPSNRGLAYGERFSRMFCELAEALGAEVDPAFRAAAFDMAPKRRRQIALFDLVLFAESAFGDVDVLAMTARVPALALRRVLAGHPDHRFGPVSIRRVARALWCKAIVESDPDRRLRLHHDVDELRGSGVIEARKELAFLDSAAERHTELAKLGLL